VREPVLELLEQVVVDGDTDPLDGGEDLDQRQFDLGEQVGATAVGQLGVECGGEIENRPCLDHRRACDVLAHAVEAELAVLGGVVLEFAMQMPQRQVCQVVGALVGTGQVRRQRRVRGEPGDGEPPRRQGEQRALRVVHDLRQLGIGEEGRQRGVVLRGGGDEIDVGTRAVGGRDRDPVRLAGTRTPTAVDADADTARTGLHVRGQPVPERTGCERHAIDVEAGLGLRLDRVQRLEQAVAQDPELERVEYLMDGVAVPRLHDEVGRGDVEVEVADELVEAAVRDDLSQVRAQRLAGLARDRVGRVHQIVEGAVLVDPLRGRLRPDPGDTGEVVTRLAHQRGEIAVTVGADAVPVEDGVGGHAGEVGDALARVKDRDGVADELERVAVA